MNQNDHIKNEFSTYIYALGGLEEIGKNTYVVEYKDTLLVVDAGIKFTNETFFGVNGMIANYEVLIDKQDKIKALIITHGHEDHIGAIAHLLRKVNIPKIIAPKLPLELIKKRLNEYKDVKVHDGKLIICGYNNSFLECSNIYQTNNELMAFKLIEV